MPRIQQDSNYTKLIDRYSRYVASPVMRLKFLSRAMQLEPQRENSILNIFKWIPVIGSLSKRAMLAVEVSKFLPYDQPAPLGLRVVGVLYRMRIGVYAVAMTAALLAGGGLVYVSARIVGSLSVSTEAKDILGDQREGNSHAMPDGVRTIAAVGSEAGLPPEKVWLAEHASGYEFYSNGARILTELETDGPGRRFYRFSLDSTNLQQAPMMEEPIGIVYHLSESDLLPFANRYNSSLQYASRALLEYARQHRLYNYVIDRFGRIYRIVRDEYTADHAGNSLWGDGSNYYVNLSASFIGICFEGKSGDGKAVGPDGINEAQIYAARVLTSVLRSKYRIEDSNCVTHGLVSVNPSNRLIGYHTDWVAGFPFEALGVRSKYDVELLAISRLGFSYDQAYISAAGGKTWPGLEQAENRLREAAKSSGRVLGEERRQRWLVFQKAHEMQRRIDIDQEHLYESSVGK